MKVPFFTNQYQEERYGHEILARIGEVNKKGAFILGPEVKRFEERMAAYTGAKHAIGVANGSDALFLALEALKLPEGAEVITTPFSFFASTSCIVRNRLKPVFVDVNERTFNIDAGAIEARLTPNTRAILPVDLFCQMAEMDRIDALARKHGLKVLEDSAEGFGMKWDGHHAGTRADLGVLSFYPTKTLGAYGDGGMVLTNDDALAAEVRLTRVHGAPNKYEHTRVGSNSRLDEIQAAVLNIKMDHVDAEIRERAALAEAYRARLAGVPGLALPYVEQKASPVWYVFSIQCERRDELQARLAAQGVGTSVYYPRGMHEQPCFAGLGGRAGDFPVAERLCRRSLALPIFPGMPEAMVDFTCDEIRKFYAA
jgi:dTDP-4-amino-4,6-dideoxygalactose transaminase